MSKNKSKQVYVYRHPITGKLSTYEEIKATTPKKEFRKFKREHNMGFLGFLKYYLFSKPEDSQYDAMYDNSGN